MRKIFTLAAFMFCASAFAQADYPNKPVRMVVSFAAGGISDVHAHAGRVWWTRPGDVAAHCASLSPGIVPGSG